MSPFMSSPSDKRVLLQWGTALLLTQRGLCLLRKAGAYSERAKSLSAPWHLVPQRT